MEHTFNEFLVARGLPELAQFSRKWIHPELDLHIDSIIDICNPMLETHHADVLDLSRLTLNQLQAVEWFYSRSNHAGGLALSIPLLNPTICDLFIEYLQDKPMVVNSKEHENYQIPELVTKTRDEELFNSLFAFAHYCLFPLMGLMWCKYPDRVETIQFAQYSDKKAETTWHHDIYSDMTAVVNLAPELYTGGGTDIRTSLVTYEHVHSIPKGYVLLFSGSMSLHRGAQVETGTRNLLVFWTTSDKTETMLAEGKDVNIEPVTKMSGNAQNASLKVGIKGITNGTHPQKRSKRTI